MMVAISKQNFRKYLRGVLSDCHHHVAMHDPGHHLIRSFATFMTVVFRGEVPSKMGECL